MSYRGDSPEAEAGRRGEVIVRQWAIKHGWLVLEASALGSGATVFRQNGKTIALDQLHIREGKSRWVDVKWKRAPIAWQIGSGRLRHGIDLPNWRDYLKIWKQSGAEACLAIVELKRSRTDAAIAPRLLWQGFQLLNIRVDVTPAASEPFPRGAAWWDRADFDDLGPIDIGTGLVPETQLKLHPWEDTRLTRYIDQDLKPASDVEMAYRLARDTALQHWHTHPIRVPFEEWWASLPKVPRGNKDGYSW